MPNNPVMKRAGVSDSPERARQYLDAAVTYDGPGTTPARRDAFIRSGPRMVEFLERAGMKFVYADGWSDYYDELPGGEPRGRSLLAELFDTRELGDWEPKLSRYKGFNLPVPSDQFTDLMLVKRTMKGKQRAAALAWRLLKGKLTGERLAGAGAAIQGRMLQIALARAAADLDRRAGDRADRRRRQRPCARHRRRGRARRHAACVSAPVTACC